MTDGELKIHSETAWDIASQWSWTLASDTRTLAAQIDVALSEARATGRREEQDVVDKATAWDACNASFQKGRKAGMEEAAKIIVDNCIMDTSSGKTLSPRQEGNRDGLHYAAAIRAAMEKAE